MDGKDITRFCSRCCSTCCKAVAINVDALRHQAIKRKIESRSFNEGVEPLINRCEILLYNGRDKTKKNANLR